MTTRPHGLGWAEGQTAITVEVVTDPPGDGIGPDHTPPDVIPGMDKDEVRRLRKDHRDLTKSGGQREEQPVPELFDNTVEPSTPNPFAARPADPREGKSER